MTDYNSLKVPELKALLGERKLLQTGVKQALISRLQEDDEKKASAAAEPQPDANKEDEITYSDDDAAAPKAASSAKPAAPTAESKTQESTEEADEAVTAQKTEEAADTAAPAQSFAMGLASTAVEEEARKRAERAKRFGIEEDDDSKKRADRAKRFGLDQKELASSLDSALPERALKRGRGRFGDGDGNRPGKRQSSDRKGASRQQASTGNGVLNDPTEKAKAEKRAARFAAA